MPERAGHEQLDVADVFFAEVFRPVLRELGCAAVAAVHPTYRGVTGYQTARDLLVNEAVIPTLDDAQVAIAAVSRVLSHITDVHDCAVGANDLFSAGALETLGLYYVERQAMRDVLLVVQRAVKETISSRTEVISDGVVEEGICYWAEAGLDPTQPHETDRLEALLPAPIRTFAGISVSVLLTGTTRPATHMQPGRAGRSVGIQAAQSSNGKEKSCTAG